MVSRCLEFILLTLDLSSCKIAWKVPNWAQCQWVSIRSLYTTWNNTSITEELTEVEKTVTDSKQLPVTVPRIPVKGKLTVWSRYCFSLCARGSVAKPLWLQGAETWTLSSQWGLLLLHSIWPGFHLVFRHRELNMEQRMTAFCSWFMKYLLLCQITESLLACVNRDRVTSFCWKHPDCCHLIQTESLSVISSMGFTERVWAVTIPQEEHWYENRYYMAAQVRLRNCWYPEEGWMR